MTSRKYFYVLSAVLALIIALIIAATVGGNMLLQKEAKKLSALKVESATVEQQQSALRQAKIDVEKYNELNEITKSVVPQDKDQAKTVREIVQIAAESGVPIKSVSFESSTLGNAASGSSGGGGGTASSPKGQPPVSQVKPVEGIPGVYTLEIQVGTDGKVSYNNFLKLLEGLEKNRRTAHVSGINLTPSDNGTMLTFNLTLNAYLKP